MSCIKGEKHDFIFSIMEKCYVCNKCKAQTPLIEDPGDFEKIAKSMLECCKALISFHDVGDAIAPISTGIMNLVYLWKLYKVNENGPGTKK